MKAFITRAQYNLIKKQLSHLIRVVYFVGDWRVYDATKIMVKQNILDMFPGLPDEQRALFDHVSELRGQDQLNLFMASLDPYVIPFRGVTGADLKKLFPKVKKLPLPDLDSIDFSKLVYLGWRDIATGSLYIVYELNGTLTGTECRYVVGPGNRTIPCVLCGAALSGTDVGLVTSVVKKRRADQYKVIGNHMCLNSDVCNRFITSVTQLESFLNGVNGSAS